MENLEKAKAWSEPEGATQTRPIRDRVAKVHGYSVELAVNQTPKRPVGCPFTGASI
jgi:hypothetical protein